MAHDRNDIPHWVERAKSMTADEKKTSYNGWVHFLINAGKTGHNREVNEKYGSKLQELTPENRHIKGYEILINLVNDGLFNDEDKLYSRIYMLVTYFNILFSED